MKYLIVGAMREEIRVYCRALKNLVKETFYNRRLYTGLLGDAEVILAESGIGKVNASITVATLIQKYSPSIVINSGSIASVVENINVGDVIIASSLSYYDVDVTGFGYQPGEIPRMPVIYQLDKFFLEEVKKISFENFQIHTGLVCSGDSFVHDVSKIEQIKKIFLSLIGIDMESAAIAQTCYVMECPMIVIRSVTDIADKDAVIDNDVNLELSAENSAKVVIKLLLSLKGGN